MNEEANPRALIDADQINAALVLWDAYIDDIYQNADKAVEESARRAVFAELNDIEPNAPAALMFQAFYAGIRIAMDARA